MTYISWSSDFVLYLAVFHGCMSYFGILSQCDALIGLTINVGHSDLYFIVLQ